MARVPRSSPPLAPDAGRPADQPAPAEVDPQHADAIAIAVTGEELDAGEAVDAPDEEAAPEVREAVVNALQHGERLDKVLVSVAPEFSRSHLQQLISEGLVQVAGQVQATASRRLTVGQRLRVELRPTASSQAFRPEAMDLVVVYEDDHLRVIDKPAGLVVHPAPGHWSGTLMNGLLARDAQAARLPRAGIVHRLDKDTSGLMVVARSAEAQRALVQAIAAHEVRREYVCIVQRPWRGGMAELDKPIGRDPVSRVRMAVVAQGRPARTDVWPLHQQGGYTALCCRLHTGRTHQIRVHLSHAGHPLVGDVLYGGTPALGMGRQALHARRLAFLHPVSGQALNFEAELPADLAQAWSQISGQAVGATGWAQGLAVPEDAEST